MEIDKVLVLYYVVKRQKYQLCKVNIMHRGVAFREFSSNK